MANALHGGAFWSQIGANIDDLGNVVRADVLDAWFPPAPRVVEALCEYGPELCRTSPEVEADPLRKAIARKRNLPEESILTGGGSSSLIFLALPVLATRAVSAVVLDPTYGEYRHVLEKLCGLQVNRLSLSRNDGYRFDAELLVGASEDLVVMVNPNSPTGAHVARRALWPIVKEIARTRIVWIDETYIEYAGAAESLEPLACRNPNVIVCKSMSKVYALSGLRVAYLVSHPSRIAQFSTFRPPWSVSLPGQVCASIALEEDSYYADRYQETAELRRYLRRRVEAQGLDVTEGVINCVLVHLPESGATAAEVCNRSAQRGVFLRDASSMGETMGRHTIRISVRPAGEIPRIIDCLVEFAAPRPSLTRARS